MVRIEAATSHTRMLHCARELFIIQNTTNSIYYISSFTQIDLIVVE